MLHLIFFVSLIIGIGQIIKEHFEKEVPAENWENKELYYEDLMKGVSAKQRMNNLKNGKYKK